MKSTFIYTWTKVEIILEIKRNKGIKIKNSKYKGRNENRI